MMSFNAHMQNGYISNTKFQEKLKLLRIKV